MPPSNARILLVTASYAPKVGGLETVVSYLASDFRLREYQVVVVTNRYPRTLPRYEELDGIRVRRLQFLYPRLTYLKSNRLGLWLAGWVLFPLTLAQLAVILLSFRPDVVNLHYLGSPALFVWLLQRLLRFRLIVSLHGGDVDGEPYRNRFSRRLFHAVLDGAERVTACSQALLDRALTLAPQVAPKATVIHNGVDVALFAQAEPYDHSRPYLFAVGQLARHKSFDTLIAAFARVSGRMPEVDLLIAGDGPEMGTLLAQIRTKELDGKVRLLGTVNRKQVASLMRGSLAVVIPSQREPFGIVALEAMASGRPIIATRIGGLMEALAAAQVVWVPADDPTSLAAALMTLSIDYSQQASMFRANQIKVQTHSWRQISDQYLDVLAVNGLQKQVKAP